MNTWNLPILSWFLSFLSSSLKKNKIKKNLLIRTNRVRYNISTGASQSTLKGIKAGLPPGGSSQSPLSSPPTSPQLSDENIIERTYSNRSSISGKEKENEKGGNGGEQVDLSVSEASDPSNKVTALPCVYTDNLTTILLNYNICLLLPTFSVYTVSS